MPLYNRDIGMFLAEAFDIDLGALLTTVYRHGHSNRHQLVPKLRHSDHLAATVRSVPPVRSLHMVRRLVHHRDRSHPPVRSNILCPESQIKLTPHSVVPETKGLTLEELSDVFRIPTARHARFGLQQASVFFRRRLSRNSGLKMPVLLQKRARDGVPQVIEIKQGGNVRGNGNAS